MRIQSFNKYSVASDFDIKPNTMLCLACHRPVTTRQHALQCKGCYEWKHRLCGTGISLQDYRDVCRGKEIIAWYCINCSVPALREISSSNTDSEETFANGMILDSTRTADVPVSSTPPASPMRPSSPPSPVSPIDPPFALQPASSMSPPFHIPPSPTGPYLPPPSAPSSFPQPSPPASPTGLDDSFDIPRQQTFADTVLVAKESSIDEPSPVDDTLIDDEPVVFEIVPNGSKRGGQLLVSSDGYSYCVKRSNKTSTIWTCSIRSKKIRCPATVRQVRTSFQHGRLQHVHFADLNLPLRVKVSTKVKQIARDQISRPAMSIVKDVLSDLPVEDRLFAPKMPLLQRVANRHRSTLRQSQPKDLKF